MKFVKYVIIGLFFCLFVLSLFVGVEDISLQQVFHLTKEQQEVLLLSRIPRTVSIVLAGMSMTICGMIMQHLTRNRFVSPTTAGTVSSVRLGVLVSLLVFSSASLLQKMIISSIISIIGTLIFLKILERVRMKDVVFIPLVGLMFGEIINAFTTFFAYKHNLIQSISAWLQGDFSMVMSDRYELIYISIPLLITTYFFANKFTIAGLGKDFSTNIGLKYSFIVSFGLIIVAVSTTVVVLTVGIIPFVGLIVPNIVSLFLGDNLKKSMFLTSMMGAIFLLICDVVGRIIIFPYEVPIGLTVGVIGSGLFLYLLLRSKVYE